MVLNSTTLCFVGFDFKRWNCKNFGGAGYRSRYLSHAKRALYHLSYAPVMSVWERFAPLITWVTPSQEVVDSLVTGLNVRRAVLFPLSSHVNLYRTGPSLLVSPSIAQLVERWTVVGFRQKSIGRWFKSGSKDEVFVLLPSLRVHVWTELSVSCLTNNPR